MNQPQFDYKPEEPIRLHEFGRNVQQMVDRLKLEPDRERRTLLAHETVRVMATVVPQSREIQDYRKRLWELLFRMAGYDLDVEVPFEIRTQAPEAGSTQRLPYYAHRSRYKQYGKHLELFLQQALALPEGPEREAFILKLGALMKQFQVNADTGNPSDAVVFKHLAELTEGRLQLSPEQVQLRSNVFGHRNTFALVADGKRKTGKKKKKGMLARKKMPGMKRY